MAPSSPIPTDTAAARAFYQERLALFAKNMALIYLITFCALNLLPALYGSPPSWFWLLGSVTNRLHLLAIAILAATWWVASRGERTQPQLTALDLASALTTSTAIAFVAPALRMATNGRPEPVLVLAIFCFHTLRAVFIPSTVRMTAVVAVASSLPMILVSALPAATNINRVSGATGAFVWLGVMTIICVLTTRVIYGLREEVREARTLGQYTLEEEIGAGGMGAVYRARHAMLRRPTAIKLLHPDQAGAQSLARFEREVRMTSRLTHPNTVAIFDYGRTPDGVFYYAMELLDGLDLQRIVELDGPQAPSRAVHILVQVCGALAEAHAIGLVHRDIKPANIILCERGGVADVAKVVDFGLVKQLETVSTSADQTGIGAILGTPLYMSPEAIMHPDTVDARSDVYALGCVGYFLLTGTPVFDGGTVIEVCSKHIHGEPEPPSTRLGRALPAALEAAILSALAKRPEDRPANVRALRDALVASGVPAWAEDDARAWWERARAMKRTARLKRKGAHSMAVDLRDQGRQA